MTARQRIQPGGSPCKVALCLLALVLACEPAVAARLAVFAGGLSHQVPVTSMREARFRAVVPQQYDFSCGAAALATLLQFHYAQTATEDEIVLDMYRSGDRERITREGFSLLDMKHYLQKRGFIANGYQVPLDEIARVGVPGIVLLNLDGYLHFVVLKGLEGNRVLIGDPARGLAIYPRDDFEAMWNGLFFVIDEVSATAMASFNDTRAWNLTPKAPLGQALDRETLASFSVFLPGIFH